MKYSEDSAVVDNHNRTGALARDRNARHNPRKMSTGTIRGKRMLPEAFLPREEDLDGRSGGLDQLTPNSRGIVGSAPSIDNRISQKPKERRASFILPRIRSKMCTELSKGAMARRVVLILWQEIAVEGTGWREDGPCSPSLVGVCWKGSQV